MLIISSLESAVEAYRRHGPSRVISLLSEEEAIPLFPGLAPDAHLKLYVANESCALALSKAAQKRAEDIAAFARAWDGEGNILIHCKRGVARSTAAAFIILCAREPEADENALMARIRRVAPHADPCPLLVHYADEILARDGRMLDAVEDLTPPLTVLDAPAASVPVAA